MRSKSVEDSGVVTPQKRGERGTKDVRHIVWIPRSDGIVWPFHDAIRSPYHRSRFRV